MELKYSCQASMIFNFIHTLFVLLKSSSNDDSVGVAIALTFLFVMGMIILKAYLDYKRDVLAERNNVVRENINLRDLNRLENEADTILKKHSTYYRQLSPQGKAKFRKRLRMVIATKEFYGKEGLEVTHEMVVLAAASIVQITFGFDGYFIERFYRIYLYPDVFYNKMLDAHLRGSASPAGVLRFSWKHWVQGYRIEDDGLNLALHELAHALKIGILKGDVDDDYSYSGVMRMKELAEKFRLDIQAGRIKCLRKYAAKNDHEFFACSMEVFFENPILLMQELPEVFKTMVLILGQDTTQISKDYQTDSRSNANTLKRALYIKPESNYSYVQIMLVAGFLLCWIPIILISKHVESSAIPVLLFAATLTVLGFRLFYRKLVLSGYTDLNIFIAFIVVGWLSLTMGLGLSLNYFVPIHSFTETYRINKVYITQEHELRVQLDSEQIKSVQVGFEFYKTLKECNNDCYLVIHQYYGIMGMKVIDGKHVYRELPY